MPNFEDITRKRNLEEEEAHNVLAEQLARDSHLPRLESIFPALVKKAVDKVVSKAKTHGIGNKVSDAGSYWYEFDITTSWNGNESFTFARTYPDQCEYILTCSDTVIVGRHQKVNSLSSMTHKIINIYIPDHFDICIDFKIGCDTTYFSGDGERHTQWNYESCGRCHHSLGLKNWCEESVLVDRIADAVEQIIVFSITSCGIPHCSCYKQDDPRNRKRAVK